MGCRVRVRFPLLILGAVALNGCDTLFGPDDTPHSLEISAPRTTIGTLGEALQLEAVVRNEDGDALSGATVQWTSRQTGVATIDDAGSLMPLSNGTVRIVARSGNAADSLTFTIEAPIACLPAGALSVPDTVASSIGAGECALEGYNAELWELELAQSQEMTIYLSSDDFDALLVILDEDGTAILYDDDTGGGTDSRVHGTLPAGTYYVVATTYFPGDIGDFEIIVLEGPPESLCPAVADLALPGTVSGDLATPSCSFNGFPVDSWRLRVASDTFVTLETGSPGFHSVIVLTDTTGAVLTGTDLGPGTGAWMEFVLPAGPYDIWVGPVSPEEGGEYTLSARYGPTTLTCPPTGAASVSSTLSGELAAGDCFLYAGYADVWTLAIEETDTLRLDMTVSGFAPIVLVVDSTGYVVHVFYSDDDPLYREFIFEPGDYRLIMLAEDNRTGSYTMTLVDPNLLAACDAAGTVTAGDSAQGALATTDCVLSDGRYADPWEMRLDTASTVTIDVASTKFDAYLIVTDSAGQVVARDDDSGGNGNASLTLSLQAGLHRFWATSYDADGVGAYTLVADTVAASPASTPTFKTRRALPTDRWSAPRLDVQEPLTGPRRFFERPAPRKGGADTTPWARGGR